MYPAEIFALFPPFPRNNKVFVALPSDENFTPRWENVLKPTIEKITWKNQPLEAYLGILSRTNDSIITELTIEISKCRLVIADLTTIGTIKDRPIGNGNVLYEIGLAHATRLPQEVILLRSDNDVLDFDIAGIRVHSYDPNSTANACQKVEELISDALKEIDLRQTIAVQKGLQALDYLMYVFLHSLANIKHPKMNTDQGLWVGSVQLNTIHRLLNLGMMELAVNPLTPEHLDGPIPTEDTFEYRSTEFGRTVFFAARKNLQWQEAFEAFLKTPKGRDWLNRVVPESQQPPSATDPPSR